MRSRHDATRGRVALVTALSLFLSPIAPLVKAQATAGAQAAAPKTATAQPAAAKPAAATAATATPPPNDGGWPRAGSSR
jgi:hypothetical protein